MKKYYLKFIVRVTQTRIFDTTDNLIIHSFLPGSFKNRPFFNIYILWSSPFLSNNIFEFSCKSASETTKKNIHYCLILVPIVLPKKLTTSEKGCEVFDRRGGGEFI
jgi:hypothetical protein